MDDLIGEFITETSESLQVLDSELVKLEQNPNNTQILGNIFRLVHTIKGTCGFLGLPRLEAVAHASENVLGKIRDKILVVSPDAITLILTSLDAIKKIVEHLTQNGEEPLGDDAALIIQLNQFSESGTVTKGPQKAPVTPASALAQNAISFEATIDDIMMAAPPIIEVVKTPQDIAIAEGLAVDIKDIAEPASDAPTQAQTIRVNIDVLETLMQMVGELVLTRNQLLQLTKIRHDPKLVSPLQHLSHITSELQEGIMKTRMQPVGNGWSKFPRLIRDLSHDLGKKIELKMEGADTELDRQLLEMIKDPLTHMVRNSADHGIELPDERVVNGKSESGTITISAFHEGGHIIIKITDDGRGLHIEKIKQKAIANGLATASELQTLSDQQIMQFIFKPGFSTAEKVTSVSGRGVGMDVVQTNIEKIGGTVDLYSEYGKGSTFNIKIPLTLAIVSVLIVEAGGERFAMPQINIQELVRVEEKSRYMIEYINAMPVLRLREALLPLVVLSTVLDLPVRESSHKYTKFVVVCHVGGYRFGVLVDKIFDTEEIVVKPISQLLKHIPVYSGNTILGDGNVIMILDPSGLAKTTGARDANTHDAVSDLKTAIQNNRRVNFLLFTCDDGAPKAVPIELISRIEEMNMTRIEISAGESVIQYHNTLMRLRTLDAKTPVPSQGNHNVIVFNYDNQSIGLVVNRIIDIVQTDYELKLPTFEKNLLGSMIIEGKATDIVDVAALLNDIVGQNANVETKPTKERRLMLVEDSPFFRSLTIPYFMSAGYDVKAVGSAKEALKILRNDPNHFDVVVSDIEMPEMDGFAFAQACQHDSKLKHLPLFAFSSTKNEQNVIRSRKAGFKDFILKTDRALLIKSIADLFQSNEQEHV